MALRKEEWEMLTESRNVGSVYLTHLIRGNSDTMAYNTLLKILKSKKLRASFSMFGENKTVRGDEKVVCFCDSSFDEMNEIITGERWLGRETGYREFGIQLEKEKLFSLGARPVIYDRVSDVIKYIDESLHWRLVNLDLNDKDCTDWTHEHEWRIPGDVPLNSGKFRVIVKTEEYKKRLIHEPGMKKLIEKPKNLIVFENEVSKSIEID